MKEQTKKTLLIASFIATGLLATSCGNNQSQDNTGNSINDQNNIKSDTTNKSDDTQFLVKVAKINLEEIQLGQLAQEKSAMQDVKEMGKMMIDDHTTAQNKLTELARKKSITIPTSIDASAQDDYNDLVKKSGADFDKKYCDMMVSGHKDAISMFEKDSAKSTDPDIKQMAVSTLPTLRKHLSHAITCRDNCKKM